MKTLIVVSALAAAFSVSSTAAAQYPAKPVRVIVPFPAGGPADIVARVIAQPLSQTLGQPVLVENKSGADGAIAGEAVARSAPDGYTLFMGGTGAMATVPTFRRNPPYDPIADFTPITSFGKYSFFLFVHASVSANTLAELIDYARAHPGKLNYGTGSTTAIFATAQLMSLAKLDMVHVPYKGDAPAFSDFVNGHVHMMFSPPTIWLAHVKEGKLRALATLLTRRSPLLPEVPTMAEAGMPGVAIVPWVALFGPAGMPKEIVERLNREMRAAMGRQDVREQMDKQAFELGGSTPEELSAYVKEQLEVWRRTAREAGIKPE